MLWLTRQQSCFQDNKQTLAQVKAKTIVGAPAVAIAEVNLKTLADTFAVVNAQRLTGALADRLIEV